MKTDRFRAPTSITLGLIALLFWLFILAPRTAYADDITVCRQGPPACDYGTIQGAVDASTYPTDVIKVASGVYTDVNTYGGMAQIVYLAKTLTIRGGYTTTNWLVPDAVANPTTLDAQDQGRVIYISGSISPTIERLRLKGGDATGLGVGPSYSHGGAVFIITATAHIRGNHISDSFGDGGGGVFLDSSDAVIANNVISDNISRFWEGAGLYLLNCDSTVVIGNQITGNYATRDGGGVHVVSSVARFISNTLSVNHAQSGSGGGLSAESSAILLRDNQIISNTVRTWWGGGVYLVYGSAELENNTIAGNLGPNGGGGLYSVYGTAIIKRNLITRNEGSFGGGVTVHGGTAALYGNRVLSNTATAGGGLFLYVANDVGLANNVVAGNHGDYGSAGLTIASSNAHLSYNTFARNWGSDGIGIQVAGGSDGNSMVTLHNTIIVSHTTGISVAAGSTVTLEATLWGEGEWANTQDWGGPGSVVTGTTNLWGDPAFVAPDAGDYHINATSDAADAGVEVAVYHDLDGDPRPLGGGYDIGADEFRVLGVIPGTPYLLAPQDGTLTTTQHIDFGWTTGGGGLPDGYRLRLDGKVFSTTATMSQTLLSLGIHTWTVQAFNIPGVSDWAEYRTVSVASILPPGTPQLVYPVDGVVTTTQTVSFTWHLGGGGLPDGYDFELDGVAASTTATGTTRLLPIGVHTWTVRAFNAGGVSDWAQARTVEVAEPLIAPGVPHLLHPPDGAITSTQQITFSWHPGEGGVPAGYNLLLDGTTITTTALSSSTVLAVDTHVWTVRALNAGGVSDWADPQTITVTGAPPGLGAPRLLAPRDGAVTTTRNITFSWVAGDGALPEGFHWKLSGTVVTATSTTVSILLSPGFYSWSVRSFSNSAVSDWSDAWTVAIIPYRVCLPVLLKHP
jgi:hypothetical protein